MSAGARMYQLALHGNQGSDTLPQSSARRLCSMLLFLRANNTFACFFFNAKARLLCGDLANLAIPQVRPPITLLSFLLTARCPPAGAAHRVACRTWARIPDSARIVCRIRCCACRKACFQCMHNPQPTSPESGLPVHTRLQLMEQHEILDAMHATMARSYLDLEIVLEDLILVLLSIRFYIRIVS